MAQSTAPRGEDLAFLRHRVGTFGLVAGGLALGFYAFRLVDSLTGGPLPLADPSMWTHLAAGLCLVGMWAALGPGQPSARFIRTAELLGILLSSTLLVLMGMHIPLLANPGQIVVMALTIVHMARAIYVPSSARRTALIAAVVGIDVTAMVFYTARSANVGDLAKIDPLFESITNTEFAVGAVMNAVAWWLCFGTLCVAASRVIYGLRKQVGKVRELGQYHIEAELGSGAMGIVYRARHALLRRETAVKLLPPERAGVAALARFEREVKLTARLKHPNTVTIYDYGRTPEGTFYYAMELLDGATLEQIVEATGALPPGRVVKVLEQAAGALAEAHELGLIHRDIKPANIMLCNQGGQVDVAKVLDFGLVKEMESNSPQLTHANSITGTPLYMPPEALKDPNSVDARSDLYALGAVAYYLTVGDHVFNGTSLIEVCSQHLNDAPAPPSTRSSSPIPESLETLILACLEKDPAKRPQSAREFSKRLAQTSVEPWSNEQAEVWWREKGPTVSAVRTKPTGTSQTIQVDFGQRGSVE